MKYIRPEENNYIENKGDALACKYYHLTALDGEDAICNSGIKNVDDKEWEIFWVSKETEDAYYGIPAEGLGLVDCMILKEDTRNFLPEEIEELEKHYYQLGSIVQKVEINPIKSKWGDNGAI